MFNELKQVWSTNNLCPLSQLLAEQSPATNCCHMNIYTCNTSHHIIRSTYVQWYLALTNKTATYTVASEDCNTKLYLKCHWLTGNCCVDFG